MKMLAWCINTYKNCLGRLTKNINLFSHHYFNGRIIKLDNERCVLFNPEIPDLIISQYSFGGLEIPYYNTYCPYDWWCPTDWWDIYNLYFTWRDPKIVNSKRMFFYFDPSPYTDEELIERVKKLLVFI